jgi:hypothetical protein
MKDIELAIASHEALHADIGKQLTDKVSDVKRVTEKMLGVDNTTYDEAFKNRTEFLPTKEEIFKNIIGEYSSTNSIQSLFNQSFRGVVDPIQTQEDLTDLVNMGAISMTHIPTVKYIKYRTRKCAYLCYELHNAFIIGIASSMRSLWFVFDNEKEDVPSGTIYERRIPSNLKKLSTFEINPYATGKKIVTDPETGESKEVDTLAINPNWINATIKNMQLHVFARK